MLAVIMVAGLLLSKVFQPDTAGEPPPEPEVRVSAEEAAQHAGRTGEVCGMVASADHLPQIDGSPTFLNLEQPHPDQLFTAVIWERNRDKWDMVPEDLYANRRICVTGTIEMHEGTPQIEVREPAQLRVR